MVNTGIWDHDGSLTSSGALLCAVRRGLIYKGELKCTEEGDDSGSGNASRRRLQGSEHGHPFSYGRLSGQGAAWCLARHTLLHGDFLGSKLSTGLGF